MLTLERILILKQVVLFSDLHIHELRLIADIAEEVEYDPGETIFSQGEPGDAMYIVVAGRTQAELADGTIVKVFSSMDCFGEMSILDDEPRSATAKAADACRLLRIDRDKFSAMIAQYPAVAMGLLRVLSRRIRAELHAPTHQESEHPDSTFRP